MKKIVLLITTLVLTSVIATSCLKEEDNSTEATIYYIGVVDSIKYSEPADSMWEDNIKEALTKLEIANYIFKETATVDVAIQSYAVQQCNLQAGETFNNKLQKISLSAIKSTIYNNHADSRVRLGYNEGADALPINEFTLHSSIYSLLTTPAIPIFYYHTLIN